MSHGFKKVFRSSNTPSTSTTTSSSTSTPVDSRRRASFSLTHALSNVFRSSSSLREVNNGRNSSSHRRSRGFGEAAEINTKPERRRTSFSLSSWRELSNKRYRPREPTVSSTQVTQPSSTRTPSRVRSLSHVVAEPKPPSSHNNTRLPRRRTASTSIIDYPTTAPEFEQDRVISITRRSSKSFSASSTANEVPSMIMEANTTNGRARRQRSGAGSWESDSDVEDEGIDSRNKSQPKTMDKMSTMSNLWQKISLYSGTTDLDLEKDRNSFSRKVAAKGTTTATPSSLPSEIPTHPSDDKRVRFHPTLTYYPSRETPHVALESYDDVFVRVCGFKAQDQRKAVIKTQEFLDRSMAFLRKTTTRRGQKVVLTNDEICMWRRVARHEWSLEEMTTLEAEEPVEEPSQSPMKPIACFEKEEEEFIPEGPALDQLVLIVNYCHSLGDSLFHAEEIQQLVTLKLAIEKVEDGWI